MTASNNEQNSKTTETPKQVVTSTVPVSALITTGIVSAVAAFSASILFLHYFPQCKPVSHPVAIVDVVKMGMEATKSAISGGNAEEMMTNAGLRIQELRRRGYIVLDARYVIAAPEDFVVKPSELIPGADDSSSAITGYVPPNITRSLIPIGGDEGGEQK